MRQTQDFDRRYAQGRPRHNINPRQGTVINRQAVGINGARQYGNLQNEQHRHTIREDRWDDYFVQKSKQWSTRLKHKTFRASGSQTRMKRTQLVASIRRIIGPERCYYLCIPVHRRPQTALPANPFDCSTAVLQPISDILSAMVRERNDRPSVVAANVGSAPRPCPPRPDSTATRSPGPNLQPAAVMVAQPQPSHDSRPAAPTEGNPGPSPQGRPPRQQPRIRDAAATSAVSSPASTSVAPRSLGTTYQPVHGAIAQPQAFHRPTTPAPVGATPRTYQQQQQPYGQEHGVFMEARPPHHGLSAKKASKQPIREAGITNMPSNSPRAAAGPSSGTLRNEDRMCSITQGMERLIVQMIFTTRCPFGGLRRDAGSRQRFWRFAGIGGTPD